MTHKAADPNVIVTAEIYDPIVMEVFLRRTFGMRRFFVGSNAEIAYNISKRSDNNYVDPTNIVVTVTKPDGSAVQYTILDTELVKLDTGKYVLTFLLELAGQYSVHWYGEAPAQRARRDLIYAKN